MFYPYPINHIYNWKIVQCPEFSYTLKEPEYTEYKDPEPREIIKAEHKSLVQIPDSIFMQAIQQANKKATKTILPCWVPILVIVSSKIPIRKPKKILYLYMYMLF